jgi:hypothetical protein
MADQEANGPAVGYVFLLAVFGTNRVCMMTEFVVKHLSEGKVP